MQPSPRGKLALIRNLESLQNKFYAMIVYDPVRAYLRNLQLGIYRYEVNADSKIGWSTGHKAGMDASIYKGVHNSTETGKLIGG
jgi:hypothetical protein